MPNPTRVLIPQNQVDSSSSSLSQLKSLYSSPLLKAPTSQVCFGLYPPVSGIPRCPFPFFFPGSGSHVDQQLGPKAGSFHPVPGQIPPPSFGALLPDLHPQELGRRLWDPGVPGSCVCRD